MSYDVNGSLKYANSNDRPKHSAPRSKQPGKEVNSFVCVYSKLDKDRPDYPLEAQMGDWTEQCSDAAKALLGLVLSILLNQQDPDFAVAWTLLNTLGYVPLAIEANAKRLGFPNSLHAYRRENSKCPPELVAAFTSFYENLSTRAAERVTLYALYGYFDKHAHSSSRFHCCCPIFKHLRGMRPHADFTPAKYNPDAIKYTIAVPEAA